MRASSIGAKNGGAVLLLGLAAFDSGQMSAVSQTTQSFLQFAADQGKRHYSDVPHEVLAVYYGWYGKPEYHSWGEVDEVRHATYKTARFPFKGAYSSHDPEVLDWQIEQARTHGITGFVVSWWGLGQWESWHDESLGLLLARAEQKHFKVSVYLEQAPGAGHGQIERAIGEISAVLTRYGTKPAFLKVDGKPVIFAYGRVIDQVPVSAGCD
jgi:glycoprotein endo-alpha-1,2-mannosidase